MAGPGAGGGGAEVEGWEGVRVLGVNWGGPAPGGRDHPPAPRSRYCVPVENKEFEMMSMPDREGSAVTFSWGRGRDGVLGTGSEEEDVPHTAPRPVGGVLSGRRISQLCCGECHTLALTAEAGAVFSWGSGLMGALGHGGRANELAPRRVDGVPFATQLAAGKHHSAALCPDNGGVLSWGWDGWEGSTCAKVPTRLSHLPAGSGCQIAAGAFHLAVLTRTDGVVS
jgi:alpha-tubulin suppressor-like RCC1 family protein